jgi:FkbM family methyltransferase
VLSLRLLRLYANAAPTERGGFRLARLARRLVPQEQWRGVFDDGRGNRLALDLATYPDVCMAVGLYERDTDRLFAKLLRPGMHFVDGGANLGYFTCRAARLVGRSGRVDAFEPDPRNGKRLVENLDRNGLHDRVRVHPSALSDSAELLTFHRPLSDSTHNHGESGRFATDGPSEAFEVEAVRGDEAVSGVPDVVKLDLEGGEPLALAGMTRWLEADRPPAVVLEHNPAADRRGGHRPGDVFRRFRELDGRWTCRRVRSWIAGHLAEVASPEALDGLGRQVNLLFRRDDR